MKPALTVLIFVILGTAACSRKDSNPQAAAPKEAQPIEVKLASAEIRKVQRSISVTGSLVPDETVSVSAEVPGRLASVHADFGQQVRKGQVVAELDKQELQIQLDRTRAALSQALARIGLNPGQEEVTPESTPAIRLATAQFEDARFKYENASKLIKTGDISQDRFNELEKAFHARRAALEAARDDLRTQLASVQALRAELRLALKRLGDATVRAPFDGAVSARLVSPGQYLRENTPILTLVKTSPLRLRVEIPESAVASVRKGDSLSFTTDAAPGAEFHAVVRELNPSLEARSRTLTVEARLVESDARLRPGGFIQVRLVTERDASIVAVPKAALYTIAGLTKLFVVRDGKAVELKVAPGIEIDGWVEAPPQIRPGDQVAVSALPVLVSGAAVKVKG